MRNAELLRQGRFSEIDAEHIAEMRQQMAEMKTDLIKWVIGIALAQISLLVGILIKLL